MPSVLLLTNIPQKLGMSSNTPIDGSCCSPSHLTSIELLVQTKPFSWDMTDNPMENLEVRHGLTGNNVFHHFIIGHHNSRHACDRLWM